MESVLLGRTETVLAQTAMRLWTKPGSLRRWTGWKQPPLELVTASVSRADLSRRVCIAPLGRREMNLALRPHLQILRNLETEEP